MSESTAPLREQFIEIFGPAPAPAPATPATPAAPAAPAPPAPGRLRIVRAPGRVNLIGEHTDYNDGFVFPMAIEPEIRLVCRSRDDGQVRLASTQFPGQVAEFSVNRPIERISDGGAFAWTNYPRGMIAELVAAGIPLPGMECLVSNTLPVGGGLSSSAALLVGTARAMLALGGLEMEDQRLALLAQKAEHEYALAPVGIMDQTIVASARAGHAMLLDCRDLTKVFVPLDPNELRVVIVNSMVRHELSGSEYGQRRRQCGDGVAFFRQENPHIKALRDVSQAQIDAARGKLSDVVFRRCRHVVGEIARATRYAALLGQKHYEEAGQLMVQSHQSLRDDYEVSTPELDFLSAEAMKVKGVYGARMTGGGFGGCIVALAQPRAVEPLTQHLTTVYPRQFGQQPQVFVTTATAGAGVVE